MKKGDIVYMAVEKGGEVSAVPVTFVMFDNEATGLASVRKDEYSSRESTYVFESPEAAVEAYIERKNKRLSSKKKLPTISHMCCGQKMDYTLAGWICAECGTVQNDK